MTRKLQSKHVAICESFSSADEMRVVLQYMQAVLPRSSAPMYHKRLENTIPYFVCNELLNAISTDPAAFLPAFMTGLHACRNQQALSILDPESQFTSNLPTSFAHLNISPPVPSTSTMPPMATIPTIHPTGTLANMPTNVQPQSTWSRDSKVPSHLHSEEGPLETPQPAAPRLPPLEKLVHVKLALDLTIHSLEPKEKEKFPTYLKRFLREWKESQESFEYKVDSVKTFSDLFRLLERQEVDVVQCLREMLTREDFCCLHHVIRRYPPAVVV